MFRVSLTGLWARRRRLAGTFFAVFLGVAFLSGTLVLSDTLRSSIGGFFSDANAGVDAVVRSETSVSEAADVDRAPVDAGLLADVRDVDGVAAAEPVISAFGQIVGSDGEAISGNGPRVAGNWVSDPELNPYNIVDGRAPESDDEVVINRGAAEDGGLSVGDRTTVLTPEPVEVTVVGVATFGTADGFGGTSFVGFSLDAAREHLTTQPDEVDQISVRSEDGVSEGELVRRVSVVLPDGVEALTGQTATEESTDAVEDGFLTFFQGALTVFAAIALLVAAISIHNTFSILHAQRTRESALLRSLGASRRQVLVAAVLEALLVGAVASVLGLAGGLGLAVALKGVFASVGLNLPASGIVFSASTVAIALPVGVLVTVVAAASPAVRASRVAPLAALRDVATERARASAARLVTGLVATAAGVAAVLGGVAAEAVGLASVGALLALVGMVVLGPVVVGTVGRVLGAPVARLRGVAGAMAGRNSTRNPRRTAAAASALMVGVGVVTLLTVFAASLQASSDESIDDTVTAELAISPSRFGSGGVSPDLTDEIGDLPDVSAAVGVGSGVAELDGGSETLSVADPAELGQAVSLDTVAGSLDELGPGRIAVADTVAEDEGWEPGSTVSITYPDGSTADVTVAAVYESATVVEDYLLPREQWREHTSQYLDTTVYVAVADDAEVAATADAITDVAAGYGAPEVLDRDEFVDQQTQQISQALGIVYVMLALAVLIALMGIANTLSLAVHERTRELGLLRAVGATRAQLRSMVRWESVITAVFGTIGGLAVGVFLGWGLVRAAASQQGIGVFAVPPAQLAVVLLVGAVAGVIAGARPGRRAARQPVLGAVTTE